MIAFEYLKIIKKTGVILILAIAVIIQCIRIDCYTFVQDADESYYRTYMEYLSGPVTKLKDEYVQEEESRYLQLLERGEYSLPGDDFMEWQQEMLPYRGWLQAKQEYERITTYNVNAADELYLVYDGGYKELMGENGKMDLLAICMMGILLCLCVSSVFSGDSSIGMDLLIHTTARGRRETKCAKQKVTFLTVVIIFILVYGGDFFKVFYKVGLKAWTAPLYSLRLYNTIQADIKIWQYILLMYLIKFIGAMVMLCVLWILSQKTKNTFYTMIFGMLLFVMPALLQLTGVSAIEKITLTPLLRGNVLLNAILQAI